MFTEVQLKQGGHASFHFILLGIMAMYILDHLYNNEYLLNTYYVPDIDLGAGSLYSRGYSISRIIS